MKVDLVSINPPYGSMGSPIATEAKNYARKTVCLMPLSCYKAEKNELYRYVDEMGLADPKVFEDADITNSLCICTLQNHKVNRFRTYEEMAMESYDPKFKKFYEANSKLPLRYHISEKRNAKRNANKDILRYTFRRCDNAKAEDFNKDIDFFESNRLCDGVSGGGGFGKGGSGWKWNYEGDTNLGAGLAHIHFSKKCEKDNFCTWWYSNKKWESLASLLQIGLRLKTVSSTCSIAIPQIDWGAISDTQLWKEGKYDEAVLDVMGLKWNGDVIVEK